MRSVSFKLHPSDVPHIARLSKEHATVLALFRENPNYASIAAELQTPIGTVKSRLHRARAAVVRRRAQAAAMAKVAQMLEHKETANA
jgi:DNA-binding NarL/FixJ family response regulator